MVSKFWAIEGWLWACTLRPARGTSSFGVGVFFRNWMLWLLLLSLSLVAGKFQFKIRSALRFQNHLSGSWKKSWREMPVPRLAPPTCHDIAGWILQLRREEKRVFWLLASSVNRAIDGASRLGWVEVVASPVGIPLLQTKNFKSRPKTKRLKAQNLWKRHMKSKVNKSKILKEESSKW